MSKNKQDAIVEFIGILNDEVEPTTDDLFNAVIFGIEWSEKQPFVDKLNDLDKEMLREYYRAFAEPYRESKEHQKLMEYHKGAMEVMEKLFGKDLFNGI